MNDSSLLFTRDYTMESNFCFGCGNSHIDTSNRRRMNTTNAGKAVKKIWEEFINDEETRWENSKNISSFHYIFYDLMLVWPQTRVA